MNTTPMDQASHLMRHAVAAATLARSRELLQKAFEGGAAGSALAYLLSTQPPDATAKAVPALIVQRQAEVRRAADAGDPDTLMSFAMNVGNWARGLGDTRRSVSATKMPGCRSRKSATRAVQRRWKRYSK
jgi:hypothetical protein